MNTPTIKRNANNELRQLSIENLKSVFENMMNTSSTNIFWDFFNHVYKFHAEVAYDFLISNFLKEKL